MKIKAGLAPAGSAVTSSLENGTVELIVRDVQPLDNGCYVTIEYPDGFTKDHQVVEAIELLPKIVGMLRGKYGVESVNITTIPSFDINSIIKAEVTNGTKS